MDFQALGKIVSVNLRRNFLPYLLAAVLVMTAMTMLMGISALNERQAAQPIEMTMPLVGAILLTPVFHPEQDEAVRDVVRSKKTSYYAVCAVRVLYSVIFLALLCGGFVLLMRLCESAVTLRHFAGGFASGLFLGAVGFFFAGVSRSVIVGYMAAFIYYAADFAFGKKLVLDMFSMMSAPDFHDPQIMTVKCMLMGTAVLLIVLCFVPVKK